jgi:GDP-L-fucose synthase
VKGRSWKGRRVLVTGGTGFIGSFLVEELLRRGAKVRVPVRAKNYRALSKRRSEIEWREGDLRDPEYCTRLVSSVDEVFHLASCRRNIAYHQERCSDVLTENVRMSLALIEALREEGPLPVTFFSTANVPPSMNTIALAQRPTVDGYVLGKALCETLWFTAARQRDFPLLILRPVGVYGPRDTFTPDGNVIPALITQAQKAKTQLDVWGSGRQERAFLYVEDLISTAFALHQEGITGIQYVSGSEIVTIRELAGMVRDLVCPKLPLRFDMERPEGAPRIIPLPMHPKLKKLKWTPLKTGLKKSVEWWEGEK